MAKSTNVELDDISLNILKQVDGVHRNSLINLGIIAISKTEYFKSLTGNPSEDISKIVDLNDAVSNTDNLKEETTPQGPNKRSKPSIDIGFDDF